MKKVFTAEQISDWFTSDTTFANVKITDVEERQLDEPSPKESRWDERSLKLANFFLASMFGSRQSCSDSYRKIFHVTGTT